MEKRNHPPGPSQEKWETTSRALAYYGLLLRLWCAFAAAALVLLSIKELLGYSNDLFDYLRALIISLIVTPALCAAIRKRWFWHWLGTPLIAAAIILTVEALDAALRYLFTGEVIWFVDTKETLLLIVLTAPMTYLVAADIYQREQTVRQLSYLAYHDQLTGLPNRQMFQETLTLSIDAAKHSQQQLSVMLIDLDRFKNVNETFGHEFGDQLLKEAAWRLQTGLRTGDVVARQGGDEFTLYLKDTGQTDDAEKIAQKIMRLLGQPFSIQGHVLRVGCSIGIAMYPIDGEDSVTLMKNADTALYRAKDRGKNGYQFFQAEMNETVIQKLIMEEWLNQALEHDEFILHYQPQVDIFTSRMNGMEALIRWNHPRLGFISPGEFIPLAEETGLIIPIGEWVLRTACKQNKVWQAAGFTPIKMAVNISPIQFHQPDFVQVVLRALQDSGLEPQYLELEITEGIAMVHVDQVIQKLQTLRDLGVHISMDDFGTGYSSLSYLKKFPINKLKIAQQFVRDITDDPDDAAIIQAIMAMAHSLKLNVIAEGVETEEQLSFLLGVKCREIQGYIFSKPIPAREFTSLLQRLSA
ncbi:putative bifunctional diguanylate cyclase/phosphodiesterase [Paenibacillus puerhi]|uniref:putative bifunctional diguanylate cyclase/phosphodiesterase n=1 Tax=Paenibacillus puerhi TaxID=2692622 RepID=UPI00135780EC|nr:EAL domain-containing protein [Paenibacillus puerhi]